MASNLPAKRRLLNKRSRVLLTSGYAEDVLERHQAADEFPIIDKPFRLRGPGATAAADPAQIVALPVSDAAHVG